MLLVIVGAGASYDSAPDGADPAGGRCGGRSAPARIIRSLWTDAWQCADKEPLPMPYQGAVSGSLPRRATSAAT